MLNRLMGGLKRAAQFHSRELANVTPKVRWSDIVQTHYYEIDTTLCPATTRPTRRIACDSKKKFRNVFEAVSINRRRVRDEILQNYYNVLPRLRRNGFHKLSLAEMESKQMEIIDELDNLRRVDLITDDVCASETYISLEEKLLLLLEASDCFTQKANTEQLMSCNDDDNRESNRACLFFTVKSKHITKKQHKGSFDLYLKARTSHARLQVSALRPEGYILCT